MISKYFIKIQNLFFFLIFLISYLLLKRYRYKQKQNTILIIRLDSIGDYVLFRNFIKVLKDDPGYREYSFSLCGNILWKDLAQTFDRNLFDNFIWIERKKFYKNPVYKYKILKQIRESGFKMVIDPTYTREILFGDTIIKSSGAEVKTGSTGALDKHTMWRRRLLTNRYFTRLIESDTVNLFEFNRNKEFFEKLLNKSISLKKPFLDTSPLYTDKIPAENYCVVFPGANDSNRRWGIEGFRRVQDFILKEYKLRIIICGSAADTGISLQLFSREKENITDLTGRTSLSELVKIISGARLLISNDTGAVHIAAAVNTPFICISNGNHLGRFHPYPAGIFDKALYIYPPEIMNNTGSLNELMEKYRFSSDLDINKITPEAVISAIRKML